MSEQTSGDPDMDDRFNFLSAVQADLLVGILTRRNPALLKRVRQAAAVSRSDAEVIMSALSEELTNNLDKDWEPTEYGLIVSDLLGQFNAARIRQWP